MNSFTRAMASWLARSNPKRERAWQRMAGLQLSASLDPCVLCLQDLATTPPWPLRPDLEFWKGHRILPQFKYLNLKCYRLFRGSRKGEPCFPSQRKQSWDFSCDVGGKTEGRTFFFFFFSALRGKPTSLLSKHEKLLYCLSSQKGNTIFLCARMLICSWWSGRGQHLN